jgi:hypothetical protein
MPPAAITGIGGGLALATVGPYSPGECVDNEFSEVRLQNSSSPSRHIRMASEGL